MSDSTVVSNRDKTAVITGATSERGIGMAVAERYAQDGWAVVILDLDAARASQVAEAIGQKHGVAAFGTSVDVANEASVAEAYGAVHAEVEAGRIPTVGALANIAGITSPVPFLETSLDLWNKVMSVNATGTYLVTKAFLPGMLDAGWGRIVNMSSVSAQRGGGVFGKVPYSAAKAAILGFTKALAREIADSGVTINSVTPGAVDTNIRVGATPESEARLAADIPLGRVATTSEIAAVFSFLSSEEAAYLQGTNIDINGASHLH
ncbi:NAD(P)-dependent dehydrogenase, short-chain alcohol dehydrogenase family [Paramicrobacterium humi]|uniref:NAD(P)-dependent dehydrogenase, short-chain alcohol dehydrogenase family n=1 Tax=Paramicrobacterium humi TaxID=640635 RepID=A0A1H4KWX3_9MICO|nr:SDR family NAD(P)-dependent oxidoreductase [Microbacterium humi]SEB62716.1 NAD(P)-dependent dehydrogenase, short-chain alcohol dehydrogenase family [Microbacterium humi]